MIKIEVTGESSSERTTQSSYSTVIRTPLPIAYINANNEAIVREGIDLSYAEEIYGVVVPVLVNYQRSCIFVRKTNGPTIPVSDGQFAALVEETFNARGAITFQESNHLDVWGYERVTCVRDLLAISQVESDFDLTIALLLENHITAEPLRKGCYWGLSDRYGDLSAMEAALNVMDCSPCAVDMNNLKPVWERVKDYSFEYVGGNYYETPAYHTRMCYHLKQ